MQDGAKRVVALKEVRMKVQISKKGFIGVINEVEMMKRITHPNIVQMYDYFFDQQIDIEKLNKKNIPNEQAEPMPKVDTPKSTIVSDED